MALKDTKKDEDKKVPELADDYEAQTKTLSEDERAALNKEELDEFANDTEPTIDV